MAWESSLQSGSKSYSHKRRNARFKGLRRVHTPPQPLTAHTAAYTAKQGCFGWGRYHYPRSVLRGSETLRDRVSERQTLPLLGLGQVCSRRLQRACGTAMRMMRVAVPRRRGPAGLRDPIAVSLTAPMGFAVLSGHDNSMQRKIRADFTHWSVPCVLPLVAAPLPCPQHPSAADKTGRWKTGSAGSCRAGFRFACARPA